MARFRPVNCEQSDSTSPCRWKDCVPATHVTVTDAATAGRWRLTPAAIRRSAGVSCYENGTGGLTFTQAKNGVSNLTNGEVTWNVRYWLNEQQLRDAIKSGKQCDVSFLYRHFIGTPWASSDGFTGRHSMGLLDIRWNANVGREEGLLADPLADGRMLPSGRRARKGLQWVPMSLIYRAAKASGDGYINATFAPDMQGVTKTAVVDGPLRATPSPASRQVGRYSKGDKITVSTNVTGSVWNFGSRSSRGWWKVTAVNGVSVRSKYGVSAVYVAGGRAR